MAKAKPKPKLEPYPNRLRRFEAEKQELSDRLSWKQYEQQVKLLAQKYHI
jgi:hypothetical protein